MEATNFELTKCGLSDIFIKESYGIYLLHKIQTFK